MGDEAVGRSGSPRAGDWPDPACRALLDALVEAVVAFGPDGAIRHLNRPAERLLGVRAEALVGRDISAVFPDRLPWPAPTGGPPDPKLPGGPRQHQSVRRADGAEVAADITVGLLSWPGDTPVALASIRPSDSVTLSRWAELTANLFDALAADTPGRSPEARLLEALGRQLGFEMTVLWAVTPDGDLLLRQVWTDPELDADGRLRAARDPQVVTLPREVVRSGEPLRIRDLARDPRSAGGPAQRAGMASAIAFPVHRGGALVGVVELFSRSRRPTDQDLVELVAAVSRPAGQLLRVLEQSADRQRLVRELTAARQRQEFVLRASRVVSGTADYATALQRLAEVAVPVLGDLCLIDLVADHGRVRRMVSHHHDRTKAALAAELGTLELDPAGHHPCMEVLSARQSRWAAEMPDEFLRATTRNERHYRIAKALCFESYMSVPLVAIDGTVLGALTLVSAGSHRHFDRTDLEWAEQLAFQVASVLDRAGRYQHEHDVSHSLQRSLLPTGLPTLPGLEVASRYLPATWEAEVGGDWYDVAADGPYVTFVVGDVEGHDMPAATVMAALRYALLAFLGEDHRPGGALERLNRFARRARIGRLAVAVVGTLDVRSSELVVAAAGHLPPILRIGGEARLAPLCPAPPLGTEWDHIDETRLLLPAGDLVLFTDGLVERPEGELARDLDRLVAAVAAGPADPDRLCDHLLAATGAAADRRDDVAMLVARWAGTSETPAASPAEATAVSPAVGGQA